MNADIAPYHVLLRQNDGSTKTDEVEARSAFEAQVQYQRRRYVVPVRSGPGAVLFGDPFGAVVVLYRPFDIIGDINDGQLCMLAIRVLP